MIDYNVVNVDEIVNKITDGELDTITVSVADLSTDEITKLYNKYKDNEDVEIEVVAEYNINGVESTEYFDLDEEEPLVSAEDFYDLLDMHIIYDSVDAYRDAQIEIMTDAGYLNEEGEYDETCDEEEDIVDDILEQIEENCESIATEFKPGENVIVAYGDILGGSEHRVFVFPAWSTEYYSLNSDAKGESTVKVCIELSEA